MTTETWAVQAGEANKELESELRRLLHAIESDDRAAFDTFYKLTVPRMAAIAKRVTMQT